MQKVIYIYFSMTFTHYMASEECIHYVDVFSFN